MYLLPNGSVDEEKWKNNGVKFNMYQRGHQHLCETLPDAYALLLVCGLFYPKYAAQWGAMWVIGSIGYALGYSVKPSYRVYGEVFYVPANIGWLYGVFCAARAIYSGTPL